MKIIFLLITLTSLFFASLCSAESNYEFSKRAERYLEVRNYSYPPRGPRHYEFFVSGGMLMARLNNQPSLFIGSGQTNNYTTSERTTYNPLGGIGIGYAFYPTDSDGNSHAKIVLGLSSYYLSFGKVKGINTPFQGGFGTLNYQFSAQSFAVFGTTRFIFTDYSWHPFVSAGVGSSWNELYNYSESVVTNPSPTSPATMSAHTGNAFAYQLGLGVQHQIYLNTEDNVSCGLALSYNYFNLGSSKLGPYPPVTQSTSNRLGINDMTAHSLLFSIITSFN